MELGLREQKKSPHHLLDFSCDAPNLPLILDPPSSPFFLFFWQFGEIIWCIYIYIASNRFILAILPATCCGMP